MKEVNYYYDGDLEDLPNIGKDSEFNNLINPIMYDFAISDKFVSEKKEVCKINIMIPKGYKDDGGTQYELSTHIIMTYNSKYKELFYNSLMEYLIYVEEYIKADLLKNIYEEHSKLNK